MPGDAATADFRADAIARYMLAAVKALAARDDATLLTGDVAFPDAGAVA